jgi:hypothetical protein
LGYEIEDELLHTITKPHTPDQLFIQFLKYRNLPPEIKRIQRIQPEDCVELIRTYVLSSFRNPFLIPLYQLLFTNEEMTMVNVQNLTCYDIIKGVSAKTGIMEWEWEVYEGKYRLDLHLKDARLDIECDESDHFTTKDQIRQLFLESNGYQVFHYNPEKDTTELIVNRLLPIIRSRILLHAYQTNTLNSTILTKFSRLGLLEDDELENY